MTQIPLHVDTIHLIYVALIFAVLAACSAILMGPRNALRGRGSAHLPIPSLGDHPVLHLELARNEHDLKEIFQRGDTQANLNDAAMGNNLDTFFFIPSYTGLLLTLGLLLGRSPRLTGHWLSLLIVLLLVPVIAICDWIENWGIAKAIRHIRLSGTPEPGDAVKISTPSLIKWTTTVIVLAALGTEAIYTRAWTWFCLAGALILLSFWILFSLCVYARDRWGASQQLK